MIDRKKVIKALEVCSSISDGEKCPKECPYMGQDVYCIGSSGLMLDALDLLKEQETHVLTLDEAVDGSHVYYVEFQYHADRGWVKCDFDRMYMDGEVAMLFLRNKTFYQQKEDYGRLWRLWSARPTYDQMKEVKWDDI